VPRERASMVFEFIRQERMTALHLTKGHLMPITTSPNAKTEATVTSNTRSSRFISRTNRPRIILMLLTAGFSFTNILANWYFWYRPLSFYVFVFSMHQTLENPFLAFFSWLILPFVLALGVVYLVSAIRKRRGLRFAGIFGCLLVMFLLFGTVSVVSAIPSPTINKSLEPGIVGTCTWLISVDGTTPVSAAMVQVTVGSTTYSPGLFFVGSAGQDFGAFFNSIHDSNAGAKDNIGETSYAAVFCLSANTYTATTTLVLYGFQSLLCGNAGSTIIKATGGMGDLIQIEAHSGVKNLHAFSTIKNCQLSGGNRTGNTGACINDITGSTDLTIERNYISGCGGDGIHLGPLIFNNWITKNWIEGNGGNGTSSYGNSMWFQDNYVFQNHGNGLFESQVSTSRVTGNYFLSNYLSGIFLWKGSTVATISANTFWGDDLVGPSKPQAAEIRCDSAQNPTIIGNSFLNNTKIGYAIFLQSCSNVVFSGNAFSGISTSDDLNNPNVRIVSPICQIVDGVPKCITIVNNAGFNPYGLISNPFTPGFLSSSITGGSASPTASTTYVVVGVPIFATSTSGTGVSITLTDGKGNVIQSGLLTLTEQYVPIGYSISFGAFSVAPNVTAWGT